MKGKYLITTDNWFFAPNGKQYNAVWGEVEITTDEILGIKTNARSSNWFAKIGTKDNHVVVAGCQIHYAVKCEEKPNDGSVIECIRHEGDYKFPQRDSFIYIAE